VLRVVLGRRALGRSAAGGVPFAHPLGNNWGNRRVKNDERDATDLADLLRLGRLAEAWIAPPEVRELREPVRYRILCSGPRRLQHGSLQSSICGVGIVCRSEAR
jgi:hypothetical protein